MARIRKDRRILRDLVWAWDPIGLGEDRKFTEDEYDCILDSTLSLLQRGAGPTELLEHLNLELSEHFGLQPQPEAASVFASRIAGWWNAGTADASKGDDTP
jgi:hypothetical protein